MIQHKRKNRVFWSRLSVAVITAMFVIPAYLFFTPEEIQKKYEASLIKQDGALAAKILPQESVPATPNTSGLYSLESGKVKPQLASSQAENISQKTASKPVSQPAAEDAIQVKALLSSLLSDYQSPELTPDQKREISMVLPEINQSAEGRNLIAAFFFYEQDPEIAAAMYDMILDARLKDPLLISELISRDEAEFNDFYKSRLIDLVADHNTVSQMHNQQIEDFLESMALHADGALKQASVSQWAWYVNEHKGILPVLDAYLFSHSPQVREEVYEMIELDAIKGVAEKREVALALDSLNHADYLALDEQEKARIERLKARLSL